MALGLLISYLQEMAEIYGPLRRVRGVLLVLGPNGSLPPGMHHGDDTDGVVFVIPSTGEPELDRRLDLLLRSARENSARERELRREVRARQSGPGDSWTSGPESLDA